MTARRRYLVPEVIQSSGMDCGPAALACLLGGFGIRVALGRLREACQTDVDGTSIDTLEEVAHSLGLEAQQIVQPVDHVLLPAAEALPALAVVRLPGGLTHFVVVWRRHGGLAQVMDPAGGRRWMSVASLAEILYVHELPVPAAAWRDWAASDENLDPLRRRLAAIGVPAGEVVAAALADPSWRGLAHLDAAVRWTADLVRARAVGRGRSAAGVVAALVAAGETGDGAAPADARSASSTAPAADGSEQVAIRGAVFLRVRGLRPAGDVTPEPLAPDLAAALREPAPRPLRQLLRAQGRLAPAALLVGAVLAAAVAAFEAILWRSLFDLTRTLGITTSRVGGLVALLAFFAFALAVDAGVLAGALWVGRRLEGRLRTAFLHKLPRLGDRYFQSRLMSDMAERSHSLVHTRRLAMAAVQIVRVALQVVFITIGLIALDPAALPAILLSATAAIALPLVIAPALAERDMRVRAHVGALTRFYLDAMLGLRPIRAHRAERSIRQSQEALVFEWGRATLRLHRVATSRETLVLAVGLGAAAWLVLGHLARGGETGAILLLAYWAFELPALGGLLGQLVRQLVVGKNVVARLVEPLGAPDDGSGLAGDAGAGPVAVALRGVTVKAGGHTVLDEIDVELAAGSHTAIVGPSGAGKSSLVGLLLGWHRPASGDVTIDGRLLDGAELAALRAGTVWIDPTVQLWNRSLIDNVRYGAAGPGALGAVLAAADLHGLVAKLADGSRTRLGEGGALVSGGEGQRIRLARGLYRQGVRLAILDEPFRGLDHDQRGRHLARGARGLARGDARLRQPRHRRHAELRQRPHRRRRARGGAGPSGRAVGAADVALPPPPRRRGAHAHYGLGRLVVATPARRGRTGRGEPVIPEGCMWPLDQAEAALHALAARAGLARAAVAPGVVSVGEDLTSVFDRVGAALGVEVEPMSFTCGELAGALRRRRRSFCASAMSSSPSFAATGAGWRSSRPICRCGR